MSGLDDVESALGVLEKSMSPASAEAPTRLFGELVSKLRKVQTKWHKTAGSKQEKLRLAAAKLVCTTYHNVGIMFFNKGNYASCVPLLKLAAPLHASLQKKHQCQLLASRALLALSFQFSTSESVTISGEQNRKQCVAYIEEAVALLRESAKCLRKEKKIPVAGECSQLLASIMLETAIAKTRLAFWKNSTEAGDAFESAISSWSEVLADQDEALVEDKENTYANRQFACQSHGDTHQLKWAKHAWQYLLAIADQLALMQDPSSEVPQII